jgi:hypothetical protein
MAKFRNSECANVFALEIGDVEMLMVAVVVMASSIIVVCGAVQCCVMLEIACSWGRRGEGWRGI